MSAQAKTSNPPDRITFGRRNRRRIPAFITALLGALCFVVLPFIARRIDGSADEFSSHHVPILPAIGWVIVAAVGAVVVTHRLQIIFSVDEGSAIAVLYDVLPLLLFV